MNEVPDATGRSEAESSTDLQKLSGRLQEQSVNWFNAQAMLANQAQKMFSAWSNCRQEDWEAAFAAFRKVLSSKDHGDVASAYTEWLTGNMDRLKVELANAQGEALRLTAIGGRTSGSFFPGTDGLAQMGKAHAAQTKATRHHE
jgi:leucyl aminopeptidase (aminopeptidase T)